MQSGSNCVDDPRVTKCSGVSLPLQVELVHINAARYIGSQHEQEIDRFFRLSVPPEKCNGEDDNEGANRSLHGFWQVSRANKQKSKHIRCTTDFATGSDRARSCRPAGGRQGRYAAEAVLQTLTRDLQRGGRGRRTRGPRRRSHAGSEGLGAGVRLPRVRPGRRLGSDRELPRIYAEIFGYPQKK